MQIYRGAWFVCSKMILLWSLIIVHAGLKEFSTDTAIWSFALENQYTIVTNDEDFYILSLGKGFPPKIILLRTGNQSTKYMAAVLLKHKSEIEKFIPSKEYGVLEIF